MAGVISLSLATMAVDALHVYHTCLTSMIMPVWFSTMYLLLTVTTCTSIFPCHAAVHSGVQ